MTPQEATMLDRLEPEVMPALELIIRIALGHEPANAARLEALRYIIDRAIGYPTRRVENMNRDLSLEEHFEPRRDGLG